MHALLSIKLSVGMDLGNVLIPCSVLLQSILYILQTLKLPLIVNNYVYNMIKCILCCVYWFYSEFHPKKRQ